jgi:hypothetical protein
LKDQTRRLFACTVSATYEDGQKSAFLNQSIASQAVLWWDAKDPELAGLWQSTVTLSEAFFNEVVSHPVPVDMRALKALKKGDLFALTPTGGSELKCCVQDVDIKFSRTEAEGSITARYIVDINPT